MRGVIAFLSALAGWAAAALAAGAEPALAPERPVDRLQTEARGFYLLWGEGRPDTERILALPFVKGGQIVVQWAEVERAPGHYDFSRVRSGLAAFAERGQRATVQVNGNQKPAWLFAEVPHVADKLSVQVRDAAGTLMFWHPRYQEAHLAMLAALARELRGSPHRRALLGVRLNFNAIGTEHLHVPAGLKVPGAWTVPPGVDGAAAGEFSAQAHEAYVGRVVSAYEELFAGWATVFVRNNLPGELKARLADRFTAGRLGWFHTSSEAEPRSAGTERQYGTFVEDARSGRTVAYAEPWASAWGEHGGGPDPRWCSPAQWNYWTLLLNLHCGVSFIGEYHANLRYAITGRHGPENVGPDAPGPREFMAAYEWGGGYVGRHNRPAESPGAWVAFRENSVVKAENRQGTAAGRRLGRFTGDYTFLAERLGPDGSSGVGPIGPAEQRYGAFARRYRAGTAARIRLDPDFVRSLRGEVTVRVIALGSGRGEIRAGGRQMALQPRPEAWSVSELRVPASALAAAGADDARAEVRVTAGAIALHLLEVRRAAP